MRCVAVRRCVLRYAAKTTQHAATHRIQCERTSREARRVIGTYRVHGCGKAWPLCRRSGTHRTGSYQSTTGDSTAGTSALPTCITTTRHHGRRTELILSEMLLRHFKVCSHHICRVYPSAQQTVSGPRYVRHLSQYAATTQCM